MNGPPLPVDAILDDVVRALERAPNLVVEAPPGAGKTTRIPPALLAAGLAGEGDIWVLEPRRLAARMAASRVAEEIGQAVGETVGYQVRFDETVSARTRIRFVTEGVLTRRLLSRPDLAGIGVVVLDEFHERHLQGDLALALLRRLQRGCRPELKVIAMSATLDATPIASFLDDCAVVRSEGRQFDVEIEYAPRPDDRPLADRVAAAIGRLVEEGLAGDVLVFLPGAAEIRRAQLACEVLASRHDLLVMPLHGDLTAAEQDRVVRPASSRKIVLSTNVAESSVTIEGVVAVVDSGLARVAGHSPWSGLSTLTVSRVSQASAIQRAGRAGRTRPGRCLRLYTAQDFHARPEFEQPEVRRLDLADAALELHAAGVDDLAAFEWFEAPDTGALEAAESLLVQLGAVDSSGRLLPAGRDLVRFPLHPRLSRLVVEAARRGYARKGCLLAAILSERDLLARSPFARDARRAPAPVGSGPSDLLARMDLFVEAERESFSHNVIRRLGLDSGAARNVARTRDRLVRLVTGLGAAEPSPDAEDDALLKSVLVAFPDRVGRRRGNPPRTASWRAEVVLVGGSAAALAAESVVRDAEFLVGVEAEERRGSTGAKDARRGAATLVRIASAVEPEWLLELFPDDLRDEAVVRWNASEQRVESVSRLLYRDLVLDETQQRAGDEREAARVLADAALSEGVGAFGDVEAIEQLVRRSVFAAAAVPDADVAALGDEDVRAALVALCEGRRSFGELREAARRGALVELLRARLGVEGARLLARLAPETVAIAGRARVRVNYERDRPPWIASRLQDFFGMTEGPRVGGGGVPVVLHLLAPNNRPVQVTSDLAGFWERHYPAIRRELSRRYPRHSWPEDPRTAVPGRR